MPRVLRILNRLIIGGPSKNAIYLSRYMQPDFDTLLVIGGKEDHELDADFLATANNIDPTCIPEMKRSISPYNDWAAYNKLKKLIKEFKPDIVHTHAAKSGALGRLAAKHSNVPVIVHTFHGHIFHSYFNSVKTNFFIRTERYLAGLSDAIVAISDVQKKELSGDFKIAAEHKFSVIPLGLDLDNFIINQEEKRNKFRTEFGLDDDVVALGIIGRLVPIKNHSLFLKGLKHVLDNTTVKFKAFIIGDGESRMAIEQMANDLGIKYTKQTDATHPHPLIFTSWRTDIDTIFAGLDVIALTSLNEGTPVSLIEAQAAGKPIVSTNVGGIENVVIKNETAFLSESNDVKGFSDQLLSLVGSENLRNKMVEKSKKNVEDKFHYLRLVKDVKSLYSQLLNNGS